MANGDYGDFVQQLSTSAKRSTTYQTQKSTAGDSGDDSLTPVIKVNTLGCIDAPLLKKQLSIDGNGKDAITVPSEWSKFWTLVRRCHVHYYRDWVCSCQQIMQKNIIVRLIFRLQTVTHLKLMLHILCAILIGLLYGDSGSNANKSIQNVGFLLIGVAYLWYTTVMPGVLKCK